MADLRRLDDQEAARRRRAWLQERHAQARELVVVLLRHVPEADVARVLDQLPAGDLQRLAHLLAHAADLQHDQDHGQDMAPPDRGRIVHGDTDPPMICPPTRPLDPEGPFFMCAPTTLPPPLGRGVPGGGPSPRRNSHMDRPGARGADRA